MKHHRTHVVGLVFWNSCRPPSLYEQMTQLQAPISDLNGTSVYQPQPVVHSTRFTSLIKALFLSMKTWVKFCHIIKEEYAPSPHHGLLTINVQPYLLCRHLIVPILVELCSLWLKEIVIFLVWLFHYSKEVNNPLISQPFRI